MRAQLVWVSVCLNRGTILEITKTMCKNVIVLQGQAIHWQQHAPLSQAIFGIFYCFSYIESVPTLNFLYFRTKFKKMKENNKLTIMYCNVCY